MLPYPILAYCEQLLAKPLSAVCHPTFSRELPDSWLPNTCEELGCIHAQHVKNELGQDGQHDDRVEPIDLVVA